MRKLIATLCFVFLNLNLLTAQVCQKINCDNIKDYVTAYITQAYLEDYIKTTPKDSTNYKKAKQILVTNVIDNPLKFDVLVKCLNDNKFENTLKLFTVPINSVQIEINENLIKEEIADKIFNQLISKLDDKQKRKVNSILNLKSGLELELNNYIQSKLNKPKLANNDKLPEVDDSTINPNAEKSENGEANSPSFFSLSNFNFFILVSLLVPIVLFILLLISIRNLRLSISNLDDRISKRKNEIEGLQNSPNKNLVSAQPQSSLKSEFETLLGSSRIFEEFQKAVEKIQVQVANLEQQDLLNSQKQVVVQKRELENSYEIFYMKYPVENSFSNNHKSLSKENTIYKFFLKANKNEADFEIHTEGVKIEEIISMVQRAIKSGCEEDNNPSNNTQKIKTITRGSVSLEGDKWVIKHKALIRYE